MAKAFYFGRAGVARKNNGAHVGIGGVARKVTSGYFGIDGVARQFHSSYVWKKYNVNHQWNYKLMHQSSDDGGNIADYNRLEFWSDTTKPTITTNWFLGDSLSISQDKATGKFTVSNYDKTGTETNSYEYWSSFKKWVASFDTCKNRYQEILYLFNDVSGIARPKLYTTWTDDYDNDYNVYKILSGSYGPMFIKYDPNDWNMQVYQAFQENVIGSYISDVTSLNPSAYPDNGLHSDGYWYVKQ